ncbi:MAG: hypothetical protein KDK12_09130 [Rhodobacteraceae bacterium]|nr:hypothetical protein [Paracoccaceae bacterium]
MTTAEPLYDSLAAHLDALGEAQAPLYLAKAALALAQALGDTDRALGILRECAKDMGPA